MIGSFVGSTAVFFCLVTNNGNMQIYWWWSHYDYNNFYVLVHRHSLTLKVKSISLVKFLLVGLIWFVGWVGIWHWEKSISIHQSFVLMNVCILDHLALTWWISIEQWMCLCAIYCILYLCTTKPPCIHISKLLFNIVN